jgi:hypothetical protein
MTHPLETKILAALQKGPKTPQEIRDDIGEHDKSLTSMMTYLLRTEKISREQLSKGRWRYYIGTTAPNWTGYVPDKPKSKAPPKASIPVKRINVARSYFGEAPPIIITLPLAPWEVAA